MFRFDSRRRLLGGFKSQGLTGSFLFLHGLLPGGVLEQPFRQVDSLIWRSLGNRRLDILIGFRITSNNAPKFLIFRAQRLHTRYENSYKFFNNFHSDHSENISKNCSLRILSFRRFEKVPEEIKLIFLEEINFQIY